MDVRHDAASLYRFVDSVCSGCERRGNYPAYLEANQRFIDYVLELGAATKAYLRRFPDKIERTTAIDYNLTRQELWLLRSSWESLHRRLKPATEADTLHLPFPLIRALVNRFREIEHFKTTQFVVIHTELLNYLQVNAGHVRGTADNIASIVGSRKFDRNLGMIGIPYSQSESLFLNCLIAHEFGHYAFSEREAATKLAPDLRSALTASFAGVTGLTPNLGAVISNLVAEWAEELFCDLFAVRIVGPAFCYAWIEIQDLPNALDYSGRSFHPPAVAEDAKFTSTHPANLYRLQQHVASLEELGWWKEIAGYNTHYVRLLALSKAFPKSDFKVPIFGLQPYESNILDTLSKLMPAIRRAVADSVGQIESGVKEYHDLRSTLDKYLVRGIVPSSVIVAKGQVPRHPSPLTVLNAAYSFYLTELQSLIEGIEDQKPLWVDHREKWARKVETWAMKATDDYLLMNKSKGA
jgi:hypothetical protein